jgi:hypothetical protein
MAIIEGAVSRIVVEERTITETTGAGTYTATVEVPAAAWILDIAVQAVALWTATTSASMEVGDGTDPDGFYTAIDLKATDLLAGESVSFAQQGGLGGAYLPSGHILGSYAAAARTITATVVTVGAAGSAGRTRLVVAYIVPNSAAASKA